MRTSAMPPLRRGIVQPFPTQPAGIVSSHVARLQPHPAALPMPVDDLSVQVCVLGDGGIRLTYRLIGAAQRLHLRPPGDGRRRHHLWRHTCFEAFVALDDSAYLEWNFSPSGDWQLYRMRAYRVADTPPPTTAPSIVGARCAAGYTLRASIPAPTGCHHGRLRLGLSAVLRTRDGVLAHWALRHPIERPDFHHADSFALSIPYP